MEQVNTTWSLADVTISVANKTYHGGNSLPKSDVDPEYNENVSTDSTGDE